MNRPLFRGVRVRSPHLDETKLPNVTESSVTPSTLGVPDDTSVARIIFTLSALPQTAYVYVEIISISYKRPKKFYNSQFNGRRLKYNRPELVFKTFVKLNNPF